MSRLPLIRHVRYFWHLWRVNRHYEMWASLGQLPVNRSMDEAALDAIWRGFR